MGQQLPVCIRCAAIYFGFLTAVALKRPPQLLLVKVAVAATALELLLALTLLDSPISRFATGLLLGTAVAPFVRIGIEQMFGVREDAL